MKSQVALSALCLCAVAHALPIGLSYSVSDSGPLYHYSFTLTATTVPNPDMGFGWLLFGESGSAYNFNVPLDDFVLTTSVVTSGGSYRDWKTHDPSPALNALSGSSSGHNGPTLWTEPYVTNEVTTWTPSAKGDTITWGGTSSHHLSSLYWSCLVAEDHSLPFNYDSYEFQHVSSTPEPASMMVLGTGAVAWVRRRKRS